MSDMTPEQQRLGAELAQLRAALQTLSPSPLDEAAVRAAYRAARRAGARTAAPARGRIGRLRPLAAAAALVLAVGAALGLVLLGSDRDSASQRASPPAATPYAVAAFQPLQNSPGLMPSGSYSVVRVRIPLASLALLPGTEQGGTIEAELLVGEDGLARGIRFMQADALLVSAQD